MTSTRAKAPEGVVVGLDNGATANNATVLDLSGRFLVDGLVEIPSVMHEGPVVAISALVAAFDHVLELTDIRRDAVAAVGLGTPGPASADGIISSKGSTNFSAVVWHGFDVRGTLEARFGIPVTYINDGNAAALYAHHMHFGQKQPSTHLLLQSWEQGSVGA